MTPELARRTPLVAAPDGRRQDRPEVDPVRYPCLEGLRAVAAVMVVVHHASSVAGDGVSPLVAVPAGVLDGGVAVFFVLSGFLIWRPFAQARTERRSSPRVRPYLVRRLARLLPAYWVALSILAIAGAVDLGDEPWRYYLLLQPYSRETALGGLVPAWSLSTELAFYVFVPLWDRLLRLVRTQRTVGLGIASCIVLYVAAFAFRALVSEADPTWRGLSFQWLPANLDLFAIGMALAVIATRGTATPTQLRPIERLASRAGLLWAVAGALLVWFLLRVGSPDLIQLADPNGAYRGFYWQQRQWALGVFSLLLLLPLVVRPDRFGLVRRSLASRPMVWLGTISYGLYLWHLPVMERAAHLVSGGTGPWPPGHLAVGTSGFLLYLVVGLGVGCLIAAISWTRLERPVQRAVARRWSVQP